MTPNAQLDEKVIELDAQRPPTFTDEALALRFAEQHRLTLRYVAAQARWLVWTGKQWKVDDTLRAFDLARDVCRRASAECNKKKAAGNLASAKTVAAVERLAKADRKLAATIDQWDTDPLLFNTPGGVVDLSSGETRQHRADDYDIASGVFYENSDEYRKDNAAEISSTPTRSAA